MAVVVRWLDRIAAVGAAEWYLLHGGDHPLLCPAFLDALESSGSLHPALGWQAEHLTLWRDDRLIAAAPSYRKYNSHGEFVFDHAFAEAYQRSIGAYYP